MYLSLPIPAGRGTTRVSLNQCLDAFVKPEVMEKGDAWSALASDEPGNSQLMMTFHIQEMLTLQCAEKSEENTIALALTASATHPLEEVFV